METCILVSPMPNLTPCQPSVFSKGDVEANGKEQYPEGEFAALLAALQKPQADKAAGEACTNVAAGLLVPAGLQLATQPGAPAGAGGDVGGLPAVPAWLTENVNALTGGYEVIGLSDALSTEHFPALSEAAGRPAVVSDAPAAVDPVPAMQNAQAEDTETVPLPGGSTAAEAAQEELNSVFELPHAKIRDVPAEAISAVDGTQPSLATAAEGKPAGASEQEKGETRPADSIAQPSVRPAWSAHEQLQAEAVRRLETVKSAVLEQVLEKMVFSRSESGEAKVYVRLKPPSLGEVEISLHLEDGRLTGRIVAESAMVRELLDASLSQLRQRLEEQHVHLAELTISTGQERGFRRGRDRPDGMPAIPAGREMSMESASAVPKALPGLLNALA